MALAPGPEERLGFLRDCLVEGDPAQEKRVRRNKQRALFLSIVVQFLIVAGLVLFPLLSRSESIAGCVVILPTVPYAPGGSPNHPRNPTRPPGNHPPVCRFCEPPSIPTGIVTHDPTPAADPLEPGVPAGVGIEGGIRPTDGHREPPPPDVRTETTAKRIHIGSIQPAMLYHRVEPVYPPLAIPLRREGRVELHAVISTDGSVQALEVISGDALFIQSALAAVREWRYHPTILNGQAVEVDTQITVIYTLNR